jgi:hypothetical protein
MQTPKEVVESFIADMVKVYKNHIDFIKKAAHEWDVFSSVYYKLTNPSQEWIDKRSVTLRKRSESMDAYRKAQSVVIESYSIPLPKDYFLSSSSGCIYIGDEVFREEMVNKNKVKIYTKSNSEGFNYERLKVFTLQKKDDDWQLVKLRRIDEETGKEEGLEW